MIQVNGGTYTQAADIQQTLLSRLYAYDPKTQLQSMPTRTIMVITNKSKSEYDSSYDLDEPVTGDGLDIPTRLEDGVWVVSSLGANAHVLGERIRSRYESIVKLDLSVPPEKTSAIRLELSSVVIDVLADLKRNSIWYCHGGEYTIRPGTFHTDEYFRMKSRNNNVELRLETLSPQASISLLQQCRLKLPLLILSFHMETEVRSVYLISQSG